jgi:uncharacterized membrane protein YjjP (DUF1212 family)
VVSPAEVLPVAAAAGELLLRCGADVARVEDTIARIAKAYGIENTETYATPTGLFITLGADTRLTILKRVKHRTMALDRVSAINALSRDLATHPMAPADALARIHAIEQQAGPFPTWSGVPISGLGAAACTMLVGGRISDMGPAFLANLVVQLVVRAIQRVRLPGAVGEFLAGATAVACAIGLNRGVGSDIASVIAGGIMVLLPGTAFTASVRDAMAGDLVSAGARGLEAFLQAASLASGVAAMLYLAGGTNP